MSTLGYIEDGCNTLSNLDMDLADILYQQDMDMGITRDFYDPLFWEKQQKQLEIEQTKAEEHRKKLEQQHALLYTIDEETGETIYNPAAAGQIELQTHLNKELEELSNIINFDTVELEKYLGSPDTQTQFDESQLDGITWGDDTSLTEGYMPQTESVPSADNSQYSDSLSVDYMDKEESIFTDMDLDMAMVEQAAACYTTYSDEPQEYKPFQFSSGGSSSYPAGSSSGSSGESVDDSRNTDTPSSDKSGESHNSDSTNSERMRRNFCRDEMRCKKLSIPFDVELITNCAVDEFNSLMRQHPLTEEQTNLIRDIRRRGKNKVAAQNCRKKKMHELSGLEGELDELKRKRDALARDKSMLRRNMVDLELQMNDIYAEVFNSLTDIRGQPFDPRYFQLHMSEDGQPRIVPISLPINNVVTNNVAAYTLLDLSLKA